MYLFHWILAYISGRRHISLSPDSGIYLFPLGVGIHLYAAGRKRDGMHENP